MSDSAVIGARVREARKRFGLTQRELARQSGISLSLITKLEQGEYDSGLRLETVHKLAIALEVTTSALMSEPDAASPDPGTAAAWEPARNALHGGCDATDDEPTVGGVRDSLNDAVDAFLASRYADLSRMLPLLLRDADALVSATNGAAQARARQV